MVQVYTVGPCSVLLNSSDTWYCRSILLVAWKGLANPGSVQAPLSDLKLKPPAQEPQHSMSPRFSAADWAQPEGAFSSYAHVVCCLATPHAQVVLLGNHKEGPVDRQLTHIRAFVRRQHAQQVAHPALPCRSG